MDTTRTTGARQVVGLANRNFCQRRTSRKWLRDSRTLGFASIVKGTRKAANAFAQLVETKLEGAKCLFLRRSIAEAFTLHLLGCSSKAITADIAHRDETERLRQGNPIGAALQELDMRRDFSEDGLQIHDSRGSMGDRALGQDCRAAGKRQALNDTDKLGVINAEKSALTIGNTDA